MLLRVLTPVLEGVIAESKSKDFTLFCTIIFGSFAPLHDFTAGTWGLVYDGITDRVRVWDDNINWDDTEFWDEQVK